MSEVGTKIKNYWRSFTEAYRKLFSIEEIESQVILQWMFGAMLFYFYVTFSVWIGKTLITVETARRGAAVCWPYFKNCGDLYFFHVLPDGFTQSEFYMLLFGLMMLIVYFMWKKQWAYAHMLLALLLVWKIFVIFVLSYIIAGPYDYYHIFLTATLLFIPHKEYFLKLVFVLLYFVSVTVKLSPAWIEGTYFSSMKTGIPLFPDWFIPISTNIVIFVQIVEAWFLLSRNWLLQRMSLVFALYFHLYSGIFVFYDYPSIALPPIAILFGPMYRYQRPPFDKKSIAGWCIIALILLFQLLGFIIPTDRYLTLEGNRFGMFMFEANHQCIATVTKQYLFERSASGDFEKLAGTKCNSFYCLVLQKTTTLGKGTSQQVLRYESGTAWNRCDPYEWWAQLHETCSSAMPTISMTFDHSINGGPFYRIVDVPDICNVDYQPFRHNEWIRLPPNAPIIGYPAQNVYHY